MRKILIVSSFLVVFLVVVQLIINNFGITAGSPGATQFRRMLLIDNTNSSETLINYQVSLSLDTQSLISADKMSPTCSDIRILDSDDETNLSYWIETGDNDCNSVDTKIWVKVPLINSYSRKTIYLYYGDSGLLSVSDGESTFEFFDDFDDLDENIWSSTNGTSNYSISDGSVTITSGAIYTDNVVGDISNRIIEAQVRWTSSALQSGLMIGSQTNTDSGNNPSGASLSYILRGAGDGLGSFYGLSATGNSNSYDIATAANSLSAPLIENNKYIIGTSISNRVRYYVDRVEDSGIESPLNGAFVNNNHYLWLGYFRGSNSGSIDVSDVVVDWVLSRKYVSVEPVVSVGSEKSSNLLGSIRLFGGGVDAPDADRIKIPIVADSPINVGSNFTLEFFMKASGADNVPSGIQPLCTSQSNVTWIYGNIIFDRDIYGDGDYGDWGVALHNGVISFGVSRGSSNYTLCGEANVADNDWHHIAVTRNGTTGEMKIFVDGIEDVSAIGPTGDISYRVGRASDYPNSDPYLVIGAEKHDAGAEYPSYSGFLANIRMSNTVRYTGGYVVPVSKLGADSDTVLLYQFDEGSGLSVYDSSGYENGPSDGTIMLGGSPEGPVWSSESPFEIAPTPTPTNTPLQTPTSTVTPTPTITSTLTPTNTPTPTPTIGGNVFYHVLLAGQSLSIGYDGAPALTTDQPFDNVKLNQALTGFVPLIEDDDAEDNLPNTAVESPASGLANMITAYLDSSPRVVVSKNGIPGASYAQLKKNGSTSSYQDGLDQVTASRNIANSLGWGLRVPAVAMIHGPANFADGYTYRNYLNEWQVDYQNDLQAITNQDVSVPMFIDQSSNFTAYNYSQSLLVQAQLDEAVENNNIYLIGPRYQFVYENDNIHLSNSGYRWLGEYYGKAIARVMNGQSVTALIPNQVVRKENAITVSFQVPQGPLVFDTDRVLPKTNYGFEFYDDSSSADISSVEILNDDTIRIILDSVPTGDNQRLRYAYTGTSGARPGADSAGSARGNLRDSDLTSSLYGNELFNWAVHFSKDIVVDQSLPILSNLVFTSSSNSINVSWNTNEASSTKVYFQILDMISSTSEVNISPRVIDHSQTITGLVPCTQYQVWVESEDLAGNVSQSDNYYVITAGCPGGASVEQTVTGQISYLNGDSVEMLNSSLGIRLMVPELFAGQDAVFQINRLNTLEVVNSIGGPTSKSIIGNYLYELSALNNLGNKQTVFDNPITIQIYYQESDVSNVDEDSLLIYRWNGTAWNGLSNCNTDKFNKLVSCQTSNFSSFGLFGTVKATSNISNSSNNVSVASSDQPSPKQCLDMKPGDKAPWIYGGIAVDSNKVHLYVAPGDDPVDRYYVSYGSESNKYLYGGQFQNLSNWIYEIASLNPNTNYFFRILPVNGCATGNWSNEIMIKTGSTRSFFEKIHEQVVSVVQAEELESSIENYQPAILPVPLEEDQRRDIPIVTPTLMSGLDDVEDTKDSSNWSWFIYVIGGALGIAVVGIIVVLIKKKQ